MWTDPIGEMTKTRHNTELFDLAVSGSMVLAASGVWMHNALQFLRGLVG